MFPTKLCANIKFSLSKLPSVKHLKIILTYKVKPSIILLIFNEIILAQAENISGTTGLDWVRQSSSSTIPVMTLVIQTIKHEIDVFNFFCNVLKMTE